MTGPEHFRCAEGLAAKAAEYLGQGDGQDSAAVWAAVAQVHATLALTTATALARTSADDRAWIRAAGPEPSPARRRSCPGVSLAQTVAGPSRKFPKRNGDGTATQAEGRRVAFAHV
jgi:hypothetical protein